MTSPRSVRIGQIVPSSNTTMETEIPAMLRAREGTETFTFHSARMRMKRVSQEDLAAMDAQSDRCALELADAEVDVMGYACLVAIMSMGHGYHRRSQERLGGVLREAGSAAAIVNSAGALIDGLKLMGARRIAVVTPYMKPLSRMVVDYIEAEGIAVDDCAALEVADNLAVGRLDPAGLPAIVDGLDHKGADAIVLSACVQMPSLAAIAEVEARTAKPVVTAATATVRAMLDGLGIGGTVPGAGALLSARAAEAAE